MFVTLPKTSMETERGASVRGKRVFRRSLSGSMCMCICYRLIIQILVDVGKAER